MKNSFDDTYDLYEKIGSGSYATVHRAINKKTGEICAIKKIKVTTELNELINEISIMSKCNCKNIVRFLASACSKEEVSIAMEYCGGGSVQDVMRIMDCVLTQEQITVILRDVLTGLEYLHKHEKIHRDVKAANILLNEEGVAKLGDFGVSEPLETSIRELDLKGTLLWLPPEVINKSPDYSFVIDIWSLGITMIEMAEGQPPYGDIERRIALAEIGNLDKPAPTFRDPKRWTDGFIDFLELCLDKNASTRKKASELLDHDIIRSLRPNSSLKKLVDEVRSITKKSTESNLYQKSECLLKEVVTLFGLYKERRMRVIRVDQMTDSLKTVEKEFKELQDRLKRRDATVDESRAQWKSLKNEICKLETEKIKLEKLKQSHQERKSNVIDQLNKIREKQRRFRSLETKRG